MGSQNIHRKDRTAKVRRSWLTNFFQLQSSKATIKMTEWMRDSGNGVTSEDYLLGKEIDKNFEQQGTMGQINAVEYDCVPESLFSSRAEHQVDLQRKIAEDPLVFLRKREIDQKRKLMVP